MMKEKMGEINFTEVREYNSFCFQCRKLAGKEPAGVPEDDLCEEHLEQAYLDLRAQFAEARNEIGRLKREISDKAEYIENLEKDDFKWMQRAEKAEAENAALKIELEQYTINIEIWREKYATLQDDLAKAIKVACEEEE